MKRLGRLPPRKRLATAFGTLEYVLSGAESPAIVLFNGAGVTLEGWRTLYPDIEQMGCVLAWNRFGVAGSSKPRQPQTGKVVVASLRELLAAVGLPPPYVLVGHSLGGLYCNLFARLHPDEVAGMVLLEATHPRDREMLKGHETQLASVLSKLFELPQRIFRANLHAEVDCVDDTAREVAAAGPFPPVPLTVVTGGNDPPKWLMSPEALRIRRANQQELARLSPHGQQVVAPLSGHFPQLTQAELVLDVIRRMAGAVLQRA
ncbi:MAG TPA: alpha/beta fold hydrolase [Ramlibacter sp.]|nr:alpha/beta fold hydrolase [Ramlibacter sp.]